MPACAFGRVCESKIASLPWESCHTSLSSCHAAEAPPVIPAPLDGIRIVHYSANPCEFSLSLHFLARRGLSGLSRAKPSSGCFPTGRQGEIPGARRRGDQRERERTLQRGSNRRAEWQPWTRDQSLSQAGETLSAFHPGRRCTFPRGTVNRGERQRAPGRDPLQSAHGELPADAAFPGSNRSAVSNRRNVFAREKNEDLW